MVMIRLAVRFVDKSVVELFDCVSHDLKSQVWLIFIATVIGFVLAAS